jgi:signal transduction histidine kinase
MIQRKVLLVDDSAEDRATYKRWLQRNPEVNYLVEEADTGSGGLAACQTFHPDCVLLDYHLPDVDGLQFLDQLTERLKLQAPAVVMMTGTGHEAVAVEAMKRGAQDYLRKDVLTIESLDRAVTNAVEKTALRRTLHEQEERLRLALEGARLGSWDWNIHTDAVTTVGDFSGVFSSDMSAHPETFQAFLQRIHPEDRTLVQNVFTQAITAKTGYQGEFRIVGADGAVRWVESRGQVFYDSNGAAVRIAGIAMDITARKQANAEREQLLAELQRVNTELQQFAYIVSHDLNEPLRAINNYAQLVVRKIGGHLDETTTEYLGFITDGAKRMQEMLTDLLAYTRVGGPASACSAVDCDALLGRVLTQLQMVIQEARAEVTHAPLPTVQGDATRLGQVFQNLIGNALKFHGPNPPRIHVSAQRHAGQWRFTVQDNGIGVDPSQATRLFKVFQRLHTRSEYPGTGIGLAICRKIVEQHGGRIGVESQPGQGATFWFTLAATEERK